MQVPTLPEILPRSDRMEEAAARDSARPGSAIPAAGGSSCRRRSPASRTTLSPLAFGLGDERLEAEEVDARLEGDGGLGVDTLKGQFELIEDTNHFEKIVVLT
jgi:hypothetical protein